VKSSSSSPPLHNICRKKNFEKIIGHTGFGIDNRIGSISKNSRFIFFLG